jgi:hypothetical protein
MSSPHGGVLVAEGEVSVHWRPQKTSGFWIWERKLSPPSWDVYYGSRPRGNCHMCREEVYHSGLSYVQEERLNLAWVWPFLGVLVAFLFWCDRRRYPPGHCQTCVYNLTGNVSGVCPECGNPCRIEAGVK